MPNASMNQKFVNFKFVKDDDLKFKVSNLTNLRFQDLTNLSHV